jgi:hypothetical protein
MMRDRDQDRKSMTSLKKDKQWTNINKNKEIH